MVIPSTPQGACFFYFCIAASLYGGQLQRFGDDERDVVLLFSRAELADLVDDGVEEVVRAKCAVAAQGFGKAFFAELLPGIIERFGDSIRIKGQDVARGDLRFADFAIPSLEHAENRRGGLDRKSTRLNSSHRCISYAVFCLKKKRIMRSMRTNRISLRRRTTDQW